MLFWAVLLCNNFYIISFLTSSVKNFFNFSFRSDLYCSDRSPSATFIDYHIWSLVSRSFFILFRSQISSDVIFSCRSFSDVDYLTIAVYSMSTTFFLFFNYFLHLWICCFCTDSFYFSKFSSYLQNKKEAAALKQLRFLFMPFTGLPWNMPLQGLPAADFPVYFSYLWWSGR